MREYSNNWKNDEEIDGNLGSKSLPRKARNIICEEIFKKLDRNESLSNSAIVKTIIQELQNSKIHPNWISKIQENELKGIRVRLAKISIKNDTEGSFLKFFHDLTNMVKAINMRTAIRVILLSRNFYRMRFPEQNCMILVKMRARMK